MSLDRRRDGSFWNLSDLAKIIQLWWKNQNDNLFFHQVNLLSSIQCINSLESLAEDFVFEIEVWEIPGLSFPSPLNFP